MQIKYSTSFIKRYRKLPLEIKLKAESKETLFKRDIFHPSLKTHKLQGALSDMYAFSVDYSYRIIFQYESDDVVVFVSIGNHDIYE